ncbi:MAG TPA: adenylyl-sulfate kinase [Ramlibacter sp.]|uniref:adenylyl-sulfate kinase n=1 Tax=Ramlibacter sp. TaxID=1917967 RepID=UPI002D7FF657|nr:adenylyl-sulfate kinase [Ramlibacter sp.]HET8744039.1 adenylyl-sulfate kinase [Ramlibacter sp.]
MKEGGLIWVTGFSGAGKTTVAKIVSEKLRDLGVAVLLLDGDDLRSILGERFGHDLDERRKLAYVYSRLCRKICGDGITVVIATIAMFESVRSENRAANPLYFEAYLDVPLQIRAERDPKGIYRAARKTGDVSTAGAGQEEPRHPDIVIRNFDPVTPEAAAAQILERYLRKLEIAGQIAAPAPASPSSENRAGYWDSYYGKRRAPIHPSAFALFCEANFFGTHSRVLEFGCGNGRDAFHFSKRHRVTAIDRSAVAIEANRRRAADEGILSIDFIQGTFGDAIPGLPEAVDAVYGRFVLHAMTEEEEVRALKCAARLLPPGGRLLLEFRTDKDRLMNEGVAVGANERVTDHYRRFINFDQFCRGLERFGFSIDFRLERDGLAKYGDDDPTVGRVIATRTA